MRSRNREIEKLEEQNKLKNDIIIEIKKVQSEIRVAENLFENVFEADLVDAAIFDLAAKKSKYAGLLKLAKDKKIKKSTQETLVEALAK
jgi:uncharacterized protein (DUF111 family)